MDNVDLTTEQIENELAELIEGSEDKNERQGSEMVVNEGEAKDNVKKDPKIKKPFVPLSKKDIEKLNKREQLEYRIEQSKNKTDELKNEYRDYQQRESKATRSLETKKLIILGRFLDTQLHKRPDRKVQYMVVTGHLDQYLTDDRDRQLLGFPALGDQDNHDRN
jgi:tRNA(Ile)-lysidine synthase TilS/MesJ